MIGLLSKIIMFSEKLLRKKSRTIVYNKMDKLQKGRQEYRELQNKLREYKKLGLYYGALNDSKSQLKYFLDKIESRMPEMRNLSGNPANLSDTQRNLIQSQPQGNTRDETLKSQKKLIDDLKKENEKIQKKTGLSIDNKEFLKEQKYRNSVKENKKTINHLRNALLPLFRDAQTVESSGIQIQYDNTVKQWLKDLHNAGKLKVDFRKSPQQLRELLSRYTVNNPTQVREPRGKNPSSDDEITVHVKKSSSRQRNGEFKNLLRYASVSTTPNLISPDRFFSVVQDSLLKLFQHESSRGGFKVFFTLNVDMYRLTDPFQTVHRIPFGIDKESAQPVPYRSTNDYLLETIQDLQGFIESSIHDYVQGGSNWVIDQIVNLKVHFAKWQPMAGGTYLPLPNCLNHKRNGLINIRNDDEFCFLYNNICHFHKPEKHRERVSHYKKYVNEFCTDGIRFPMTMKQIPKWDKLNNTRTFIFSPIIKNGKLQSLEPIYIDKHNVDCPNEVCHLLIEDTENNTKKNKDKDTEGNGEEEEQNQQKYHFVYIDNISALSPSTKASEKTQYLCCNCMNWFRSEEQRDQHQKGCLKNDCATIKMPPKGSTLRFKEFQKMNRLPFMIEFDIESDLATCKDITDKENLQNQHLANSICGHFHSDFGDMETQRFYGSHCVQQFVDWLTSKEEYIKEKMIQNEKIDMSDEDERSFKRAKKCYLCKQPFPTEHNEDKALYKVRDHDHATGKYRGACHASCNLNYNTKNFVVPVVAHNLKGYDSQLIIRQIAEYSTGKRPFDCIPMNSEKFISFSLGKFRFIDSYAFMADSLDGLVDRLRDTEKKTGKKQFHNLESYYGYLGEDRLDMLKKKGVYPYQYANGENSFDIKGLPKKKWFYDDLHDTPISDKKYKWAQKVFKEMGCETFQDYHDLYLTTDVLLLADVMEGFRQTAMENDGVDPAHFYGLPGYAFTVLKKYMMEEGQKPIELLTDYDKFIFCESYIRGGLSQISHRYARANNKYCPWYDPSKPTSYIIYFDMNSLYPTVMSFFPLPHSGFEWRYDYTLDDILNLDPCGSTGCAVECDIEYPEELHESHNDYPCALEQKQGRLSPIMQSIAEALNYKLPENLKLIANLEDKYHYKCDYRCLQLYHMLGLRVTKIHKVLEFKQTYSMKTYVDTMRQRRANSNGNKFLEQYYKDMMNIPYGKTVENERNYSNLEVCTDAKKAQKKINSFRCKSWHGYSDNLLTVNMDKNTKTLGNKPIFLGCTILELSKLLMLQYHYTVIKQRYGEKARLLFTDTDSLMYHIETESNVYDDMIEDYQHYDFSAYDKDSEVMKKLEAKGLSEHVQKNKKCFGLMKDEQANNPIIEFAGRCPKEYSYKTASDEEKMKGKGVPSHVLKNQCRHEDSVKMILSASDTSKHSRENFERRVNFKGFRTIDHNVYTEKRNKTGMSILDSKRYVCDDGVSTLAFGHKDIV